MPYPDNMDFSQIEGEDPDTSEIDAAEAKVAKLREVVMLSLKLYRFLENSLMDSLNEVRNYILHNFTLGVSREERENAIDAFEEVFNGYFTGTAEIVIINEAIDEMVHEYLKRARGE